jgi:hypothetical protein
LLAGQRHDFSDSREAQIMKSLGFVCLLFVSATFFGQSNPSSRPHQTAIPSRAPQGLPFAQTGAPAARRISPQSSGLNFAPAVAYNSGGYAPLSVALADVNGDGKLDMVVANCGSNSTCDTGTIGVLLGNGDGTFQTAVSYNSGGYFPASVALADVNGDGKLDIVVSNSSADCGDCGDGAIGVLLGNGDGTFQAATVYGSGGFGPGSLAVADVNQDGKPDVVVANECSASTCANGVVGILLGNGDGTFQPATTYSSGGYEAFGIAVADLTGDGNQDVIVANYTGCPEINCYLGTVDVLAGDGDGTFEPAVSYTSAGFPAVSVAAADLNGNGDGILDLAVGNGNDTVGILIGTAGGVFFPAVGYGPGDLDASSLALADVNGDGKLDVLMAIYCDSTSDCSGAIGSGQVLLGNGDGTFQSAVTFDSDGYKTYFIAAGDANGDGKPDMFLVNECADTSCANGTVAVLLNTSTAPTTTALVSSLNPSNYGQTVTLTATVTPQYEFGKTTPTGTVNFFDGVKNLGSSSLNSAEIATLSTSTLTPGTHSITATYNGDTNFGSSTSPALSQVVQGPSVRLSPKSINFGNQTVGMGGNQGILVNLTNTGNIALTISSIGITGADSADFFETNICPSSIPAGGVCMLTVGFAPTTTGTRTAALSFTDNAPGSPQTVSLTGVGVLPAVTFSPASLTFPTQIVFTSSKAQTVTLTNTGVGTLSITNITATGAFTQTNNCGSTVNSGSSCTLNVTSEPTKSGSSTGSLSITDNAPLSPQTVSLKGTGTDIQFTPASFNFGNQPVGTKSLPKKFTLTNKGGVAVSIAKISLIGANAPDFAETNTCGTSVAAGASCFITVTFTPSADGKRTADISVSDNGGGSPQTVALSGTGT